MSAERPPVREHRGRGTGLSPSKGIVRWPQAWPGDSADIQGSPSQPAPDSVTDTSPPPATSRQPACVPAWISGHQPADPGARFDPSVPHPARVYNYWLGGANFEADREVGRADEGGLSRHRQRGAGAARLPRRGGAFCTWSRGRASASSSISAPGFRRRTTPMRSPSRWHRIAGSSTSTTTRWSWRTRGRCSPVHQKVRVAPTSTLTSGTRRMFCAGRVRAVLDFGQPVGAC